jgi:hypothetical protein
VLQARGIVDPGVGQKQPQLDRDQHLIFAGMSQTRLWQLAVLPTTPAYCEATATECVPFLGSAVSSITRTASGPPTSRLA